VNVISSDKLTRSACSEGKTVFYSGLINRLKLSDEKTAIVMGHEVSHALREHSREQVSR
jgi:Zn-dependent protease with chaperone function